MDKENLYLVIDHFSGGDLRFHISRRRKFTEEETSKFECNNLEFFVACIIQSLQYIHDSEIIHRDLKPENLIFDTKGYLHLTDFGIARVLRPDNHRDTSGTPGYMGILSI